MRYFVVTREIVAFLLVAMFVVIPIASAQTAVMQGTGRGTHTTFDGASSSAGSVSMTAGHSASANVGFDVTQVGKGKTTQTISGGSALAVDPFATVEVGNANVTVTAKVTGKDHTADTGVASASGHLTAAADETDNLSPEGIFVSTFIGSNVNVMTGEKGKSAEAWANAEGFATGLSAVTNDSFTLSLNAVTAGDTWAHAKVTGKNSEAGAGASIAGAGNASTTASISTGAIETTGYIDGTGEASSAATGVTEVDTGYQLHSGINTSVTASGSAATSVTANGGTAFSEAELEGQGVSSDENSSIVIIQGLGSTSGKATADSSASGHVEAATSFNVSSNLSSTEASLDGETQILAGTEKGSVFSAAELFGQGFSTPNFTVSAVDLVSQVSLVGIGNANSYANGAGSAVANTNVSGNLLQTSVDAAGDIGALGRIRTAQGMISALSVLEGVSVAYPGQDAFTLASGATDASSHSGAQKCSADAVAAAFGEVIASGNVENQSSGSTLSNSASTGLADLFSQADQDGPGTTLAQADVTAVTLNDVTSYAELPLEENFVVFNAPAQGETAVSAGTAAIGDGSKYDGDAQAYAETNGARTDQLFSDTSGNRGYELTTIVPEAAIYSFANVDGGGLAFDEGNVEAVIAFGVNNGSVGGIIGPESPGIQGITTEIGFDAGLLSFTGVSHTSDAFTSARGATADASGNSSGETVAMGSFGYPPENGSTFNDAFGVTSTDASATGRQSSSEAEGKLGGLQIVDLNASFVVLVDGTESSIPLLDDGILSETWSTAAANAFGKNAFSAAETGAFDQGTTVYGTLDETLPPDGTQLSEISAASVLGTVSADASVLNGGESESFSGAGSFDITGINTYGNFTTGGGSGMTTSIDGETFARGAFAEGSAQIEDISVVADGISQVSNSATEFNILQHHSGLSDDSESSLTVTGVSDAEAFTFALALQQASIDPNSAFNGTSSSYGAFAAETEMNGPASASAMIDGVDISGMASTSGNTGADPTFAELFFTNGHAEANLVGAPLGGSSGAGIQTETLISVGPQPASNEAIADGHSTTPSHSYAFGYGEGIAVSDQTAVPDTLPDLKLVG